LQEACSGVVGDWVMLSAAVTEVLTICGDDTERQPIVDRTTVFSTKLAELTRDDEAKANAHQMLAVYLESCSAVEKKISQLQKRTQDDHLMADEVSQLRADVDEVRSQLSELESRHPEMKKVMDKASLVIKDRTTQAAVDLDTGIQKLLYDVAHCGSELDARAEKLAEVSEMWLVYSDTKTSVQRELQELQKSISAADVKELSLAGVREFMEHLLGADLRLSETSASYEQLKSTKQELALLDPSSIGVSEDEFRQITDTRSAMQSELLDNIHKAAVVIENWQSCDEIKNSIESVCTKAKSLLSEHAPVGKMQALRERLTLAKVFFCYICGCC